MSSTSEAEMDEVRRSVRKLREMLEHLAPLDGNRSLAITSAALIEDALKGLLHAFVRKEYIGKYANAPAYQVAQTLLHVGLINERESELVGAIAKLRNAFAHNWRHTSFYQQELADSVSRLQRCACDYANTESDHMFQPMKVGVGQLLIYLTTALIMSLSQREVSARRLRASLESQWPPRCPDVSSGLMFAVAGGRDADTVDLVFAATPVSDDLTASNGD